jgi:CubicO group peptidase (beta-lactamase class C family)
MSTRQRFRFVRGLAVILALGAYTAVRADAIDDYIAAEMREQNIPGISVAVIKSGRVAKAQGCCHLLAQLP